MIPAWLLWLASSAVSVVSLELIYRFVATGGAFRTLVLTSPLIVLIQLGLFYGFRSGHSQLVVWGAYTVMASLARCGVSAYNGEATWQVIVGCAVMLLGALMMKLH